MDCCSDLPVVGSVLEPHLDELLLNLVEQSLGFFEVESLGLSLVLGSAVGDLEQSLDGPLVEVDGLLDVPVLEIVGVLQVDDLTGDGQVLDLFVDWLVWESVVDEWALDFASLVQGVVGAQVGD